MMANTAHDWSLVGPWYRKESLGGGAVKRSAKPILQKYASSDFSNEFIKEPQKSLKFVGEDFVTSSTLPLNDPVAPGDPRLNSNFLKLFLDTHSRFYLVVCELHCNRPGFPSTSRDQVANAGFVIRKYSSNLAYNLRGKFEPVMKNRALIRAKMARVEKQIRAAKSKSNKGSLIRGVMKPLAKITDKKLTELEKELQKSNAELLALKEEYGVKLTTKGWFASENKGIGSWEDVESTPQSVEESYLPLYPLIADPTDETHSATGKTLWFGVVPTMSSDVDKEGNPRYDDESLYEVRCFVQRQPEEGCCCSETVWSEPTESYKIAPFFDLDGCGHKPINIKLPNLEDLKNQVARGPVGKGANVRMKTPDNSSLTITTGDDFALPTEGGPPGGGAICFFAIPLITIVAMFLLKLFLPIVVFLFQLWFLLSLRLCIPPSIDIDVDLAVDLKVLGPEFDFDAKFGVDFKLGTDPRSILGYADLRQVIEDGFDQDGKLDPTMKKGMFDELEDGNDARAIAQSVVDMTADYSDNPEEPKLAASLPKVTDGLHYFEKLEQLA